MTSHALTTTLDQHVADPSPEGYATPELRFVGHATDVVFGPPGGGFDGPYGMTEPQFEFEDNFAA